MQPGHLRSSSDGQTDQLLLLIEEKAKQLKNGIGYSDRMVLKDRLQITWGETTEVFKSESTSWRKKRAGEVYTEIQKTSDHLLLPAILVISPTVCTKPIMNNILDHFLRIEDYERFQADLKPVDKKFLDTIAMERGFSGSSGYIKFIRALFPQSQEPRQIQFAYSSIPLDNIDTLFQIMRKGIETSQLWAEERERGESVSSFGTALIPAGDKDCCFTITIGREEMMEGLRLLRLSQLKL